MMNHAPPAMWEETTIGDLIDRDGGSIQTGPFGTRLKAAEYTPEGVPVISVGEVGYGHLRVRDETPRVNGSITSRLPEYVLLAGDVVFGRKGAVDRCALVRPDQDGWFLGSDGIRLRLPRTTDASFIAYWLQRPSHRVWMLQHAAGSTMPSLNEGIVRRIPVALPPLDIQRSISGVLRSLDDKIEHNRRTSRALEGLARAMFKAWFVDFEPVHAKAAGATSYPGMPPEAFAALPTRFTDSELGPVPERWEKGIRRVAELERIGWLMVGDGYRAKRSDLAEAGLPFIRAGNVNGSIETVGAELLGTVAVARAGVKRSQVWDTVFTSKGTVGRLGLVTPATGSVVYAPQVCFWRSVVPRSLSPFFLHLWLHSGEFTRQWISVKGQTDMADFVSLSDQRAMMMLVPPPEFQRAFDCMVQPLIELRAQLASESAKLAELRDYLLPKLLSGEVRIRSFGGDPAEVPTFHDLREVEPFDWPGRRLVEQDNMGDWGAWLERHEGTIEEAITDADDDCSALAESLARDYLEVCLEQGYPLPADSDTEDAPDVAEAADLADLIREFTAYLRAWQAAWQAKARVATARAV